LVASQGLSHALFPRISFSRDLESLIFAMRSFTSP
jgi:hypothetical protein